MGRPLSMCAGTTCSFASCRACLNLSSETQAPRAGRGVRLEAGRVNTPVSDRTPTRVRTSQGEKAPRWKVRVRVRQRSFATYPLLMHSRPEDDR